MNFKVICEVSPKEGTALLTTEGGKRILETLKSGMILDAETLTHRRGKSFAAVIVNAETKMTIWSSES